MKALVEACALFAQHLPHPTPLHVLGAGADRLLTLPLDPNRVSAEDKVRLRALGFTAGHPPDEHFHSFLLRDWLLLETNRGVAPSVLSAAASLVAVLGWSLADFEACCCLETVPVRHAALSILSEPDVEGTPQWLSERCGRAVTILSRLLEGESSCPFVLHEGRVCEHPPMPQTGLCGAHSYQAAVLALSASSLLSALGRAIAVPPRGVEMKEVAEERLAEIVRALASMPQPFLQALRTMARAKG